MSASNCENKTQITQLTQDALQASHMLRCSASAAKCALPWNISWRFTPSPAGGDRLVETGLQQGGSALFPPGNPCIPSLQVSKRLNSNMIYKDRVGARVMSNAVKCSTTHSETETFPQKRLRAGVEGKRT